MGNMYSNVKTISDFKKIIKSDRNLPDPINGIIYMSTDMKYGSLKTIHTTFYNRFKYWYHKTFLFISHDYYLPNVHSIRNISDISNTIGTIFTDNTFCIYDDYYYDKETMLILLNENIMMFSIYVDLFGSQEFFKNVYVVIAGGFNKLLTCEDKINAEVALQMRVKNIYNRYYYAMTHFDNNSDTLYKIYESLIQDIAINPSVLKYTCILELIGTISNKTNSYYYKNAYCIFSSALATFYEKEYMNIDIMEHVKIMNLYIKDIIADISFNDYYKIATVCNMKYTSNISKCESTQVLPICLKCVRLNNYNMIDNLKRLESLQLTNIIPDNFFFTSKDLLDPCIDPKSMLYLTKKFGLYQFVLSKYNNNEINDYFGINSNTITMCEEVKQNNVLKYMYIIDNSYAMLKFLLLYCDKKFMKYITDYDITLKLNEVSYNDVSYIQMKLMENGILNISNEIISAILCRIDKNDVDTHSNIFIDYFRFFSNNNSIVPTCSTSKMYHILKNNNIKSFTQFYPLLQAYPDDFTILYNFTKDKSDIFNLIIENNKNNEKKYEFNILSYYTSYILQLSQQLS